jgi:8-amino-3,8-dideoxy-alpha-D-manno-octulosonate transaminase
MVHMHGTTGNLQGIVSLCRKRRLPLIEDVAQACGAMVGGRKLGSFGDISCFSLQLNKTMTTGEGGVICLRTRELYSRAFAAHDMGTVRNAAGIVEADARYATWGGGSRMSELTGAIGLAQLAKLPEICDAMRERKYRLQAMLSDIAGLSFRRVDCEEGDAGTFLLTVFPKARDAKFFVEAIAAEGVSNVMWMKNWGMHIYSNIPALVRKRPVGGNNPWTDPRNRVNKDRSYGRGLLPRLDGLIDRTVIMGIAPVLSGGDLKDISDAWHKVAKEHPLK